MQTANEKFEAAGASLVAKWAALVEEIGRCRIGS